MQNPMMILQQFNQFRQTIKGNPRDEVMKLVNSGQISQQQLNDLQMQATYFQKMFGIK